MKYIIIIVITVVLLIPFFPSVEAADGMPPLTQLQKEIREDGYSDGTILVMLVLVISGITTSVLFFRKDLRKKFNNTKS